MLTLGPLSTDTLSSKTHDHHQEQSTPSLLAPSRGLQLQGGVEVDRP